MTTTAVEHGGDGDISSDTADKVVKAKVALENFYTNLLAQHTDRANRYFKPAAHLLFYNSMGFS